MKELILTKAESNKNSIKVENKPKDSFSISDLVEETGLTIQECDCLLRQLQEEGSVEAVSYITGSTVCGVAIKSTVFIQKSTSIKKEASKS